MYHRQSRPWPLALLAVALLCPAASGQIPTLQSSVISAQDATVYKPMIRDFVGKAVALLKSDAADAQKKAREALASKAEQATASASFLNEYSAALNELLTPLAQDKDVRVRLNAAIANARVAAKAGNAQQADATAAFIKDAAEPVVLWGLKAARYEIPALLKVPATARKDNLTGTILPAVKAHPSGPIIEEAYAALTLTASDNTENLIKGLAPDAIKLMVSRVQDLLAYRAGLYGERAPENPLAESRATLFLTLSTVWDGQAHDQQAKTLQLIATLVDRAMQLAPNAGSKEDQADLINLVRKTGKALIVVGQNTVNAGLLAAGQAISEINASTPDVPKRIQDLKDAIKGAGFTAESTGTTASEAGPTPTASNH